MWVNGVLAVGLLSTNLGQSSISPHPAIRAAKDAGIDLVLAEVNNELLKTDASIGIDDTEVLQVQLPKLDWWHGFNPEALIQIGNTATAFFQLPGADCVQGADSVQRAHCDVRLIKTIDRINRRLEKRRQEKQVPVVAGGYYIVGASPDWGISSGSAGSGFGGGSPDGVPTDQPNGQMSSPTAIGGSDGTGTIVYVLDTTDTAHSGAVGNITTLLCAPGTSSKWCAGTRARSPATLLDAGTPAYELDRQLVSNNDDYLQAYGNDPSIASEFKEHGVFVSELIHHRAPGATVVLMHTLDDYGVSDLWTLDAALSAVLSDAAGRNATPDQVIVNLSLSIEPPPECLSNIWNDQAAFASHLKAQSASAHQQNAAGQPSSVTRIARNTCTATASIAKDGTGTLAHDANAHQCMVGQNGTAQVSCAYQNRMYIPIGQSIEYMAHSGYRVVAAAGNDSDSATNAAYGADMPAAFCGVWAAAGAATPTNTSNWQSGGIALTQFSNLPSLTQAGNDCLGVDTSQTSASGAVKMSVNSRGGVAAYALGQNVCSLLLTPSSSSGFGTWQGTSFAAAFVSGNLASMSGVMKSTDKPFEFDETQPCTA